MSFPNQCENICIDPSFEVVDVREQLENLNVNKSVGVDKVHPYVLKECSDSLSQPLSLIFQKCFTAVLYQIEWLIESCFKKLKNNKAVGNDFICNEMLKNAKCLKLTYALKQIFGDITQSRQN